MFDSQPETRAHADMTDVSNSTSEQLLDRDAVLDRVGGDQELLREITEIFLSEYPTLIDEIRAAVGTSDPAKLEVSAHTLKGSVANFGAEAATEAARKLEIMARKRQMDEAPTALQALELHFAALLPALEKLAD